jgi:hypothetical protein
MSRMGNNKADFNHYPDEELPKPATHLERFRAHQTRLNWAFATVLPSSSPYG